MRGEEVIGIFGEQLAELENGGLRIAQSVAGQRAQQERINAVAFGEIVVKEKHVGQRGGEVIDFGFGCRESLRVCGEAGEDRARGLAIDQCLQGQRLEIRVQARRGQRRGGSLKILAREIGVVQLLRRQG